MDVTRYATVNTADDITDTFELYDNAVAAARASDEPLAVVEITFTYDDTELVWTPDGSTIWPPQTPSSATAPSDGPTTTPDKAA